MNILTQLLIVFLTVFSINLNAQCWESVSVGYAHNLAVAQDGTLWSWGLNHDGELGNGTIVSVINIPTQIGTDTDWNLVSAGTGPTSFSMATKDNGTLWAWGDNGYGQVGDNTFADKYSPVQVGTDTDWQSMSAGFSHALAIKTNSTLWAWGRGTTYALGNGGLVNKENPTQVGTLNTWSSVSAGDRFSLAVKTDGTVWGWGRNTGNPLGIPGNPTQVSTPTEKWYFVPGVIATSAASAFSFDIKTSDLLVYTGIGGGTYNQSGGTTCAGCPEYYVTTVDAGKNTTAIIKTDGTLWYSGVHLGYSQPTVQYATVFTQLGTSADWSSVSVGNLSGAAIKNDGSMWTWGWNSWGQLGIGVTSQASSSLTLVSVNCPFCVTTTGIDNIASCDEIIWLDGNTYSSSNSSATHTLLNAGGCDSIVTLNLTITPLSGTDTKTSCDSLIWIDGNTYFSNNNTATHTIINGSGGCDSTVTLNLTINTIDTTITINNDTITANATGSDFQWIDCDNGNAFLTGETNHFFTANTTGNYAVIVSKNGCSDTSACTSIIVTEINNQQNSIQQYQLFPNPTKGNFTLSLNAIANNTSITIYDVLGNIILHESLQENSTKIDLSDRDKGIYILKIKNETEIKVVRVLKE